MVSEYRIFPDDVLIIEAHNKKVRIARLTVLKTILRLTAVIFLLQVMPVYGQDKAGWHMRAGLKGAYSEGLYDGSFYTKPYLKGSFQTGPVFVTATGAGLFNYSVYNTAGDQKQINLYQGIAEAGLYDFYGFVASLQYEGTGGELEFRRHDMLCSLEYMFHSFRIGSAVSYGINKYVYKSVKTVTDPIGISSYVNTSEKIDTDSLSLSLEGEYYFTQRLSFDLSYSYIRSKSDVMDIDSDRSSFRLGSCYTYNKFMIMDGFNYGWDSNNYRIYGFDICAGIILISSVKLTAMYIFSYNEGDGLFSSGILGTSVGSTLTDGSYVSHRVVAGVEYIFF